MTAPGPLYYEDIQPGTSLGPVELVVTPEVNRAQLVDMGVDTPHLRTPDGAEWVEPSVLARNYMRALRSDYEAQGAIHTACAFQLLRKVRVGERLRIRGKVSDKYIKRGRPYVVIETVTEDEDGNAVCRETNTVMVRMRGVPGDA